MTQIRAFLCTCFCFGVLSLFAKTTGASSSNYDVVYHRISFTIAPSSGNITNGSVTTYFKTTVANVTSLQFDLDGVMTVSSASYHGAGTTFTQNTSTDVITINVPNIGTIGTLDSVTVNYSGTPANAPSSGVPSGYNIRTHGTSQPSIYTLGEAFTGHNWWPCKESLYDKIDSVDLIVTAPNTYKVAGNGVVTEVVSGSNIITTWKTRYPTATYGVNFAVANYQNYQFTITSGGKTFPVMNYFFPEDNTTTYKGYADQLKNIIPAFSTKLNVNYPFANEKYGLAECTAGWGALEVQSMTFMASDAYSDNGYTIAHEAAHQWFGDMVTTNDWHQIWLNEGFAQYFQDVVYPELLRPATELSSHRTALKGRITSSSTVYVPNISSANNIFIPSSTLAQPYDKGAMLISMLRTWVGDAGFFNGLHDYLNAPSIKYNFGAVDSLKKYMQAYTPNNLDNFFADWVNKAGYTSYALSWGKNGKAVKIRLVQSVAGSGTGYYDMPVPVRMTNATGLDTTVVIIDRRGVLYNSVTGATSGTNSITYTLSQVPTTFTIDPQDLVLTDANSISGPLAVLAVHDISLKATEETHQTKLQWTIGGAENLTKVDLERSGDGTNFSMLNSVAVHANVEGVVEGSYADNRLAATSFYRLKMTQNDGQVQYSKIEKVNGTGNYEISLVPNPVTSSFRISRPSAFDADCILTIRTLSGQVVKTLPVSFGNDGWVSVSFDGMDAGAYVATLSQNGKEPAQVRFMKL